jgi:hypothetical protein
MSKTGTPSPPTGDRGLRPPLARLIGIAAAAVVIISASGADGARKKRRPGLRVDHLGRRTVQDVGVGARVTLRDPVSGRVDRRVRIAEAFVDRDSDLPVALLRFTSGEQRHVAVDRLRLIGAPISVKRGYLRRLERDTVRQIAEGLGLQVDVRTITQSGAVFARGLPAQAEGYRSTEGWGAYARGREIRLDRDHYEAFVPAVRIHEALHTVESEKLAWAARRRGLMALVEGLTDHFTRVVCRANGLRFAPAHGYSDGPLRVAARLDRLLGSGTLLRIFREGTLDEMGRAVDRVLGRGVFQRAMGEMRDGRFDEAAARLAP